MNTPHRSCLLYACLLSLGSPAALAQSVAPANDGTGTAVGVNGNQYDITGGSTSGDGANLFHSFERFGLTQAEIANFIADPAIQNILGRITGGNASVIDGLLQVSGSGANLYLINPAGILLGPNSALNLDGSFTATTATGISFGGGWLQAIGSNDYAALVGNPTGFAFAEGGSGAIASVGNLAVSPGETITLIGGAVINTGTLNAPGGQITIQAVPGENLVRISQSGSVLSLELATLPEAAQPAAGQLLEALDLPELLTGGNSGITVNADNTLTLSGATVQVPGEEGDAIASGSLDVSGEIGGTVQVLGDRVAVVGADINASGTNGGGTVLVGGDYQGQGTSPTASRTYVDANASISVDASTTGDGGEAIVWANETTQFYGSITARGGSQAGDGGFVEVSGRESLDFQGTVDATAANGQTGTLLLDPNNITIVEGASNPADLPSGGGSQLLFTDSPGIDIAIKNGTLNAAAANVVLQAEGQITFDAPVNITAPTVSLTAQANGSIVVNKNITTNQGDITLNSDRDGDKVGAISIVGSTVSSNGGAITLGGGADPATGFAVGTAALPHGVRINSSIISSGGGNISVRGQQAAGTLSDSGGVWLQKNSTIDSGSGTITIAGTAVSTNGANNIGVNIGNLSQGTVTSSNPTAEAIVIKGDGPTDGSSTNSAGVVVEQGAVVSATGAGGGIQITGTGGAGNDPVRNHGILLIGAGDATISSNSGPIVLNGTAGGGAAGIGIGDTSQAGFGGTFAIKSTTGDITLNTNSISVSEQPDTTFQISSTGTLTIQPQTAGRPIEIGGVANNPANTLGITQRVLSALQNGFESITFGEVGGFNPINVVGPVTFSDPVVFASTFQVVTVTGGSPITGLDDASVTFATNTTNLNADVTTSNNAIAFQGRTEVGNAAVTVNAGSAPVTFSGKVVTGANVFTVAADGISFDNLVSGSGDLRLQPGTVGRGMALGGAGVEGFLNLSSFSLSQLQNGFNSITFGGADGLTPIKITGPVTFADPVTFAAGSQDITVDSAIVGTDNATITFDGFPVFLNADVTTDSTAITFLGQVAVGSDVLIRAGAAPISFASAVFAADNDLTLAADTINLSGPVGGSGNLALQAGTPGLPISVGGVGAVGGTLALDNTRLGLIEEGFASITIGAVGSSGPINIADSVTFGDPVTFASASQVTVNGPVLGVGDASVTFAANNTELVADVATENNAIAFLGQTTVNETVSVNAGEAAITFSGPVSAAGDPLTLTANEINFGGPVSGTGSLTLQPATAGEPIAVAGTEATPGLDLTLAELNQIQSGFSAVNIGRIDGSNEIRVNGSYTTPNPLFFRAPNGSVNLNNPITVEGNGALVITGPTALTADLISGNQPLTFDSPVTISRSITLNAGTSAIAFNSSVSAGANSLNLIADDIDFSGPVSGSGALTLRPQSQPRISLGGAEDENSLSLSNADLSQLRGGFSSITIGTAGSGQITVQEALTFSDPVTLQANTVTANGLTITGTDNASVALVAAGGIASTGPVQISAPGSLTTSNITAPGQAVSLQSGDVISTGNVNTSSPTLSGGAVTIKAQTAITTGAIDSSSGFGSGGSVLLDPLGDIEVSFINAEGGLSGSGGDITIATGRFFRATGSFPSDSGLLASLSSTGGISGGTITLQHGGGTIPFKVGDAALNGTAAAITTGFSGDLLTLASGFRPIFDRLDLKTNTGRILIVNAGAPLNLENPCFENCSDPAINIEVSSGQEDLAAGFSGGLTQDPEVDAEAALSSADSRLTAEFSSYLGTDGAAKPVSLNQVQGSLAAVPQEIPALLMVGFGYSGGEDAQTAEGSTRDSVPLELILVTPSGDPIFTQVPEASRRQVLDTVERLRRQISDPNLVGTTTYLEAAQQLYRWIIAPLETTLADQGITSLAFVMDEGLRSLPIAALHTGKSFLVEEYSLGLIPSLNLVDLTYRDIRDTPVLVGGASEFATEAPLLAAPVEIAVLQQISAGQTLTNEAFTVASLKQARQQRPYSIVHLATHGSFARGSLNNSYLQFADGRLYLNQLRELNWSDPPVDLVTLSACQTAMGNREAELGFAGLAIAAGARSALASLWKVSDESTTGLMVEFYQQLRGGDIKATALQAAQLAMLRGEVYTEDSQLIWTGGRADLPPELLWEGRREFTHPFYWAAFTLVGSPW